MSWDYSNDKDVLLSSYKESQLKNFHFNFVVSGPFLENYMIPLILEKIIHEVSSHIEREIMIDYFSRMVEKIRQKVPPSFEVNQALKEVGEELVRKYSKGK